MGQEIYKTIYEMLADAQKDLDTVAADGNASTRELRIANALSKVILVLHAMRKDQNVIKL